VAVHSLKIMEWSRVIAPMNPKQNIARRCADSYSSWTPYFGRSK